MTTIGFQGYAPGAIKTRDHLTDLIIEARKGKKAIRLYAVEQGGHFSELVITSRCKIEMSSYDIESFPVWVKSTYAGKRFYSSKRCLGDLNIVGKNGRKAGHNRHQLFANRRLAQEYSERLKADTAYQQSVKDWHARSSRMFGKFGGW